MKSLLAALLLAVGVSAAWAVQPDEMLPDPAQEARARAISAEVRCVVCQNESIDSSNADIAAELRRIIRERIAAGDSDEQILTFLVERYGDFVLLDPPFKPATWVLWFGPPLVLLLGSLAVVALLRRRRAAVGAPAPLNAEEQARLAALLRDGKP